MQEPLDQELFPKERSTYPITRSWIWLVICSVGVLVSVLNWPFAGLVLIFGTVGFSLLTVTSFNKRGRHSGLYFFVLSIVIIWNLILHIGALFLSGNPLNIEGLKWYYIFLILLLLIRVFRKPRKQSKDQSTEENLKSPSV